MLASTRDIFTCFYATQYVADAEKQPYNTLTKIHISPWTFDSVIAAILSHFREGSRTYSHRAVSFSHIKLN